MALYIASVTEYEIQELIKVYMMWNFFVFVFIANYQSTLCDYYYGVIYFWQIILR